MTKYVRHPKSRTCILSDDKIPKQWPVDDKIYFKASPQLLAVYIQVKKKKKKTYSNNSQTKYLEWKKGSLHRWWTFQIFFPTPSYLSGHVCLAVKGHHFFLN